MKRSVGCLPHSPQAMTFQSGRMAQISQSSRDTWREKAARNSIIWRLTTKVETFLSPKEEDVCVCVCVCVYVCVCVSHSVVSNSLRPYGLYLVRLLFPWGFSRQEYWSGLPWPPQEGGWGGKNGPLGTFGKSCGLPPMGEPE